MRRSHDEAREMLMSRRRDLARRLPALLSEEQQLHEEERAEADWIDRAVGRESADVLAALSEVERRELQEIDDALGRIDQDRYGRCERCGATIGGSRLRAIPEARLCLDCSAEQRER